MINPVRPRVDSCSSERITRVHRRHRRGGEVGERVRRSQSWVQARTSHRSGDEMANLGTGRVHTVHMRSGVASGVSDFGGGPRYPAWTSSSIPRGQHRFSMSHSKGYSKRDVWSTSIVMAIATIAIGQHPKFGDEQKFYM